MENNYNYLIGRIYEIINPKKSKKYSTVHNVLEDVILPSKTLDTLSTEIDIKSATNIDDLIKKIYKKIHTKDILSKIYQIIDKSDDIKNDNSEDTIIEKLGEFYLDDNKEFKDYLKIDEQQIINMFVKFADGNKYNLQDENEIRSLFGIQKDKSKNINKIISKMNYEQIFNTLVKYTIYTFYNDLNTMIVNSSSITNINDLITQIEKYLYILLNYFININSNKTYNEIIISKDNSDNILKKYEDLLIFKSNIFLTKILSFFIEKIKSLNDTSKDDQNTQVKEELESTLKLNRDKILLLISDSDNKEKVITYLKKYFRYILRLYIYNRIVSTVSIYSGGYNKKTTKYKFKIGTLLNGFI